MKLSDALSGMNKVIETEGNLDNIDRLIITENEFMIVIDGKVYNVVDYKKLIKER